LKARGKRTAYKRIAFIVSLLTLVLWATLGTGTSLAWFTDTSEEITNIFHVANFELELSHWSEKEEWEKVDSQTKVFDEEALYEPGYVQVVYLKVENKGSVPFDFYTAVNVNGYTAATNVFGQSFLLQDYLKFGVVTAESESEMRNQVSDREKAVQIANMPLHNYATTTARLDAGKAAYLALIVQMPKEVDNYANYREETVPKVELGITVKVDQIRS